MKVEVKLVSTLAFASRDELEAELNRLAAIGWEVIGFQQAVYTLPSVSQQVPAQHVADPIFLFRKP